MDNTETRQMTIEEHIASLCYPNESNPRYRWTKNNDLLVEYTNDYPMQHGKGEQHIIPKALVEYIKTVFEKNQRTQ